MHLLRFVRIQRRTEIDIGTALAFRLNAEVALMQQIFMQV